MSVNIIFSVQQKRATLKENLINHLAVKKSLTGNGLKFHEVIGSCKGELEFSFFAESTDDYEQLIIKEYAKKYHQESILVFLSTSKKAWLNFCDSNKDEFIGYWQECDPLTEDLECFTFDSGIFYTCKEK